MTEVGSLQDVEAPSRRIEDFPLYKTEDRVSRCSSHCYCNPVLPNIILSIVSFPAPGVDLSLQERLDKLFPDEGPKVEIV